MGEEVFTELIHCHLDADGVHPHPRSHHRFRQGLTEVEDSFDLPMLFLFHCSLRSGDVDECFEFFTRHLRGMQLPVSSGERIQELHEEVGQENDRCENPHEEFVDRSDEEGGRFGISDSEDLR